MDSPLNSTYMTENDLIIIGGGLVGLSVACSVLEKNPGLRVVILEKGVIPTGASTKNAGFFCTNSYTEFINDIDRMGKQKAIEIYVSRWKGLLKHQRRVSNKDIDLLDQGSYELITEENMVPFATEEFMHQVNQMFYPYFQKNIFTLVNEQINDFGFNPAFIKGLIYNHQECQIDPGKLNRALYKYAVSLGCLFLTGADVVSYERDSSLDVLNVWVRNQDQKVVFKAKNIVFAVNAYIREFFPDLDVYPLRGQVVLTKPIPGLKLKGLFCFQDGQYYFRDFQGRVLLGGGEYLDFEGETTLKIEGNTKIQNELLRHLQENLLPNVKFEIESMWSGLQAFNNDRTNMHPICEEKERGVFVAGRCSGMGVSLSSYLGDQIEELIYGKERIKTTFNEFARPSL